MNERNLVDLLLKQADRYTTRAALCVKREGRYQDISWNEFRDHAIQIACALHQFGIGKGDCIGLLSENRPEWVYADMGILALGAVVVPVYPTASLKDVEYVLAHCEAKFLFVSTAEQLARVKSIQNNLNHLKQMVVFDFDAEGKGDISSLRAPNKSVIASEAKQSTGSEIASAKQGQVHNSGDLSLTPPRNDEQEVLVDTLKMFMGSISPRDPSVQALYQSLVSRVGLDDLATIIYTSGTTGPAKGVMLSHRNFLVNCYDAKEALPLSDADKSLSFLPLSHVFERMAGYYLCLFVGATIAYAENMITVPENLCEVRPTIACGVPRFFEKMYARIQAEVTEKGPLLKTVFEWAVRVGREVGRFRVANRPAPFFLRFQRSLAQKLVYAKIYQKLGGRLRCFISGGAPLAKELAEFFYSVGILILEGYGLTETSPVISANRWERFKFGSVGIPFRNVETKIAEDGEIVVRGPSIMLGYYKDKAATEKALEGGWFHTGDLGRMDSEGFLMITGRKKDIIVTSGGKNISPQNIENLVLSDPLISQIVVVGDKHHFITALIVPNFEQAGTLLKSSGEKVHQTPEELVQNESLHHLIRSRLEERTKDLASYEQIKYFTLLSKEFSQERGEVTLTLKIKRAVVQERFRQAIERMYVETEGRADEGRDRIFYVL